MGVCGLIISSARAERLRALSDGIQSGAKLLGIRGLLRPAVSGHRHWGELREARCDGSIQVQHLAGCTGERSQRAGAQRSEPREARHEARRSRDGALPVRRAMEQRRLRWRRRRRNALRQPRGQQRRGTRLVRHELRQPRRRGGAVCAAHCAERDPAVHIHIVLARKREVVDQGEVGGRCQPGQECDILLPAALGTAGNLRDPVAEVRHALAASRAVRCLCDHGRREVAEPERCAAAARPARRPGLGSWPPRRTVEAAGVGARRHRRCWPRAERGRESADGAGGGAGAAGQA
mmetsp:Transcript_32937/g.84066  ORF Transcript_32937/g.84066 Transcript_32937/m.84066 type:complete len:292 (-) Transcript_32937:13-888(-)